MRAVSAVAVGMRGDRPVIVSGSWDGTVLVWDLADGIPIDQLPTGPNNEVRAVAVGVLGDRPVIVSGGQDGTIWVWNLADGTRVGQPFVGHEGEVRAVAVSKLGNRPVIISGSWDRTVRVWQPNGQVKLIINLDAAVTDIAVGPTSTIIVATSKGLICIQLRENGGLDY